LLLFHWGDFLFALSSGFENNNIIDGRDEILVICDCGSEG
jgi:hypothetical protein